MNAVLTMLAQADAPRDWQARLRRQGVLVKVTTAPFGRMELLFRKHGEAVAVMQDPVCAVATRLGEISLGQLVIARLVQAAGLGTLSDAPALAQRNPVALAARPVPERSHGGRDDVPSREFEQPDAMMAAASSAMEP